MVLEKIYAVRHGFRLNWVTIDWKSETGLPRDPPLAAYGVTQAQELAVQFLSLPREDRPTAIFSSPYYRCLQTAKPIANALQIPLYVEHGISEWYSRVAPGTGLHPRPGSASSLKQYFPEIDTAWDSIYYSSRQGEDVDAVHERAKSFLSAFIPHVESTLPQEQHSRVMLMSHAATVIVLARALVGDRQLPLRVGCCTVSEFVRDNGGGILGTWKAVRLADGSLLSGGSSRDWGFEDVQIAHGKAIDDSGISGVEADPDELVGLQIQASKM
ncbi:hypothetical protein APHAL10511_006346 [Amanita phalloides]|nr:hypothetical protein APHAL10511_006346 [Amanita phalloides]